MFRRSSALVVDIAVAMLFTAISQYEVWVGSIPLLRGSVSGSRPAEAALALVMSGSLAIRRRAPLVAAGLVASVPILTVLLAMHGTTGYLFEGFVAAVFMIYSTAANTSGRASLAGALILTAGVVVADVARLPEGDYQKLFGEWIFFVAAWSVGKALRHRLLRNRQLVEGHERDIRQAIKDERARIARELHDVVAHSVSVMVLQAGAARQAIDSKPEKAKDALMGVETTGREALAELRRLLEIVRPERQDGTEPGLAPQPSLSDIRQLIAQVGTVGIPVDLSVEGNPRPIPKGVDVSAYRIVQEAITNSLKHGSPSRIKVTLCYMPDAVQVEVVDDGAPVTKSHLGVGTGRGLIGMRERAALYGGRVEVGPMEGGGFLVRAQLPLDGQ